MSEECKKAEADAVEFANRAIEFEEQKNFDAAIYYYRTAAQTLNAAYLLGSQIAGILQKASEYIKRAEELHKINSNKFEEKFSVMNVCYMSKDKFASCEKVTAEVTKNYAQEEMVKAILDEKPLAESRGDIDSDGYYCITLIVDGGWCKRSYGHGYNASSGVSVLIGMSTQKIVFIGVRNKVCLICCAIANGRMEKKDHLCWKNWKGPSTAVEGDSIVEGLLYLETVHHIRCTRLVGDGDSNTIAKCRERISYGGRILKVECANHAVRRYGRAIQKLQGNTTRFSGPAGIKGRQLLKQKIMKLIKGAHNAIKSNAINNHNQPQRETVSNLISNLRNVPNHVKNFSSLQSNTLIWNATNNPAETFLSQLCKIYGGKRIDFSKSGGFNRRADIVVLAFRSPAQQFHEKVYKIIAKKSPSTPLTKFLSSRRNRYLKQIQRKNFFPNSKKLKLKRNATDSNYGENVERPDVPVQIYDNLMENHLSKLKVQNIYDLESETRGKKSTPCSKLVMCIVYGRDLCNAAMKYGLANEIALKQYEREYSTEVKICGLFVDKDKPFLCASPDGLVGDDGLIEIKCPYSARFESNLLEFLITKKK
ncbi:yqaJ domain-containing protein [Trichonephila clavipes]|uniref:YqaJ domain-containing protein n=1 Tax=Trichonephila clavipes TaxID=2585209 RepID=A0A8X6VJN0_TRICX|nr:yqaJ domain-containing protein [Trichonephila clavipes]